jgi:hypothetical protein
MLAIDEDDYNHIIALFEEITVTIDAPEKVASTGRVDVNKVDPDTGETPLMRACKLGRYNLVQVKSFIYLERYSLRNTNSVF